MATSPASDRDLGTGASPTERRRHPRARFSVRRPVSISLDRKSTAVVLDVSQAGVGIRSLGPIRRGSTCRLHFHLPDTRERIEAEAVATWSDDSSRAGFQFTEMTEAARTLLSAWVERRTYSGPSPFSRPANTNSGRGTEIIALERQVANLEQEDALRLLVARCQSFTEADGAAIALAAADGFVCRAMLGNAPDLGVTISPDSGLSGECLRTGVVVRCENTELDPRVDREVCRALNLRSVVVVPVTVDSYSVAGLLEVFSSRPHAFSGRHVLLLRQIAELISAVTSKHSSRAPSSDSATEAPTEQLEPDHTPSAPAPAEAPAPIPAAEASSPSPKPSPVVCDVCGFENLPIDRDCQNCDVPLPTALDDPLSFTVEAPPPPEVCEVIRPVRAAQSAPHSFSSLMMWFLLGVVIAVSAFAVVRWRYNQPTHAAQGSVELSPILNTAVEASSRPEPVPASSVTPAATTAAPAPKPKPSPKQTREPEVPVREAKLPSTPQPQPAPSAPDSLALVSASKLDSPLVAVLSAPAAAPRWVIASSAPVPARLVHRIEPVYPKAAMARHIEGTVVLHAIVTHKGAVHSVTVVKGNDLLAQAAVQAVKQWRYSPAQLDGQPVDADANITISFSLAR